MLTDAACRNAACPPDKKRARFTDSGGLYLEVSPAGSKRWFWKTYSDGKEGRMSLGSYPVVSLNAARRARDAAKLQKAEGINPVQARKAAKLRAIADRGDTFKTVGTEWFAVKSPEWGEHHRKRELRNLLKDLFPLLGDRPMKDIDAPELLAVVKRVEKRGSLNMAHRVLSTAQAVCRHAVATGRAPANVARDLVDALPVWTGKHHAAITDPDKLGPLLRAIRGYQGGIVVRAALQLYPYLFQRPTELRAASWDEFDLDDALWTIPAKRMKRTKAGKENGPPHYVPLSTQVVAILRELHDYTGPDGLVFPGMRGKGRPISDNTIRAALQTLGYSGDVQTVHGFRATALTVMSERLEKDPAIVDAQLAHSVKDANGRAYNRTTYLRQRAEMMQDWADYLDKLAAGVDVLPLHRAA
ncbi:integrase arm-type DNA-binding domain-containing protein [Ottowia sp.]|uniref:tyrosine-type recombinase/integrase n=1 Tax=Ottowia sp. TaxID=1898956 RepID=UPI002BCE8406|nr:integrase arm-type DNA-binding domain-containing protein [Ottowia sp.]HRN76596.1 integrase arm-type DNA-binding domain-containing protein [Ottowia sp.]HRQ03639.1 integrase arm-type DNA-binding domain-containing protein [Ottowia sp.]